MKKYEELFILIKSLTKSEKRYFKLFYLNSKKEGSKYLQLFNAIDEQDYYNEKLIREKFKGEAFISQLHVAKNYLNGAILKCLRNYHSNISKEAELKDTLRNIEILYQKELFKHCLNEIKRAKRIAFTYEVDTSIIEILSWERKIIQALTPTNFKGIENVVNEQKNTAKRLNNTIDYWKMITKISSSFGELDTQEFLTNKLLQNSNQALTAHSKVLYYHCLYYLHLQNQDREQAEQALYDLINYLENNLNFLKEDPGIYISTVNNYVTFLIFNKRFEDAKKHLSSVKNLIDSNSQIKSSKILQKQIFRTYNIELEIIKDQKEYNLNELMNIESFILKNEPRIPEEYLLSFWFQLSSIFFENKNYSKSLNWINKLMQFQNKNERLDLLIQGRILNLLVHYELKNFFALGYFIDSTKRFLNKFSEIAPYQKLLFSFLSKASKLNDIERMSATKALYKDLFPKNNEAEISDSVMDYIDYKKWIENNITK